MAEAVQGQVIGTPGMDAAVHRELDREMLRSERQRAALVGGAVAALLLLVWLLFKAESAPSEIFQRRSSLSIKLLAALLLYESGIWLWLRWRDRAGRPTPTAFRYLRTFLEVSVPTALIAAGSSPADRLDLLDGAAPFGYFIFIGLSTLYLEPWLCLFAGAVAASELAVCARLADAAGGDLATVRIKSAVLLLVGATAAFVAVHARRRLAAAVATVAERDRAIGIFGQHVSPQVADILLHQNIELGGEEREVCVMFLDIRDFSVYAAAHTPSQVVDYLNTLFSEAIAIVNRHEGFVNKFLGDGFMAVFGAPVNDPQASRHAAGASSEILRMLERFNTEKRIPPTRLGIGLHTGRAVTGNVGSESRKEYTIIGDAVNLAARIEQATKQFGAPLLVSETVWNHLDPASRRGEDLGEVTLKGQAHPTRIFRLSVELPPARP
jgi:adenylate cyclase